MLWLQGQADRTASAVGASVSALEGRHVDRADASSQRPVDHRLNANRWEAFLDDLQQTFDKFAMPQADQAEIKPIIASTRSDIVV